MWMHDYDSLRESLGLLVIVRCDWKIWPFIYIIGGIYGICIYYVIKVYIWYDVNDFWKCKNEYFQNGKRNDFHK